MDELSGREVGEVLQQAISGKVGTSFLHCEDDDVPWFLVGDLAIQFLFDEGVGSFLLGVLEATAPDGRKGYMHRWDD